MLATPSPAQSIPDPDWVGVSLIASPDPPSQQTAPASPPPICPPLLVAQNEPRPLCPATAATGEAAREAICPFKERRKLSRFEKEVALLNGRDRPRKRRAAINYSEYYFG